MSAMDQRLDLRGLKCPLPVLKTNQRLGRMKPGETLYVETTDPLASIDIPAFCAESGNILVETRRLGEGHAFVIERAG